MDLLRPLHRLRPGVHLPWFLHDYLPESLQKYAPDSAYDEIIPLLLVCLIVFYWYLSRGPLGKIPGPFTARISRLWMAKHSWDGDMHRTMVDLHQRYGKLVRTGPNEVSVSDLTAIKQIYGQHSYCPRYADTKSHKEPVPSSGRAIGIASGRGTASLTFSRNEMSGSTRLNGGSSAEFILWRLSKIWKSMSMML